MKNAIVIHPMVQCMINRNLCQKITDYLLINGVDQTDDITLADYIFFSGCGVLEANETEGILIIKKIISYIKSTGKPTQFVLVGCLPKINRKTQGIDTQRVNGEQFLLDNNFSMNPEDQFVIVDNYNYSALDKMIAAKIPFERIDYPTEISAQNGITQLKVQNFLDPYRTDNIKQNKSYLDLIRIQTQIANMGFFFPASNDYLMLYGFKQIVIGYGCKNHCTYCAVKFAKDKIESVPLEKIVNQIEKNIEKGVRKFVLIADDFASWGVDFSTTWVELLKRIDKIECDSIELAIFNIKAEDLLDHKEIIDILATKGKIKYICVMSQHVNSNVLRRMGRVPFNKEQFLNFINEYGNRNIQIEAFNIIGFPGETEEELNELCEFIKQIHTIHYANYNTPFSPRYGTPAYNMKGRIPTDSLMSRVKKINHIYKNTMNVNFSVLPLELRKALNILLEKLEEHEFDYEKLSVQNAHMK